ncbi:MAG: phenylacetate--CoA ligase family protein [Acidobacteriota bacterium]
MRRPVDARSRPVLPWAGLVFRPSLRAGRAHPVLSEWRRLEDEQWLSPRVCAARHLARLGRTLHEALASVPYYRQRCAGQAADVTSLRLPEDLARWPILSRAELTRHRTALTARDVPDDGAVWNQTGGSTGTPVSFLQDDTYRTANLAATARHDRWSGWEFGARCALLWGADRDLAARRGWRERLATRWLRRQIELNAFDLSEARLAAFTRRMRGFRPQVVRGYAGALDLWAAWLETTSRPFPPPRGIISCAETLTETMRERVSRIFESPIFDRYGSREFGLIASQCEAGSYHVNTRGVWVEILIGDRPAEPGETGRVVITGLACRSMPLVRYDTGDVAENVAESRCACGRGLPRMGRVCGRTSDFIVAPDGRRIHGEFFTHLFYGSRHVREFTVAQEATGAIVVSVVGDGDGLAGEMETLVTAVRAHLGERTEVVYRHVAALPAAASGKRRFVSSARGAASWSAETASPGATR